MEWHLTESQVGSDTDELPVLSEEAILLFETALEEEAKEPRAEAEARRADRPEPGTDTLVSAVETLRSALAAAEGRWLELENQLRSQDRAITELRTSLKQTGADAVGLESLDATARPKAPDVAASEPVAAPERKAGAEANPVAAEADGVAPVTDGIPSDDHDADDRELLERIAALEIYIAGRADRWRDMEQEVEAKNTRIAELEAELSQRIVREQQLEERLHHEGDRSIALRDKLRRMRRLIEQASLANRGLDATAELIGPVGELRSIGLGDTRRATKREPENIPELVCLSSDMRERYRMNKDAITIGRAPECDIQIATDFVSRQHATIRREAADMFIEDESSTNGVYVNAVRVSRQALMDGDEITIGESRFRFVRGRPQQDLS
jgi:FHA domain